MALAGNYMQNIISTLWRSSNRPWFLTLLNEFPLIKIGYHQWVFKTCLLNVELLLFAFVHLLLTQDLGWQYEMHEPLPSPQQRSIIKLVLIFKVRIMHCQWAEPWQPDYMDQLHHFFAVWPWMRLFFKSKIQFPLS